MTAWSPVRLLAFLATSTASVVMIGSASGSAVVTRDSTQITIQPSTITVVPVATTSMASQPQLEDTIDLFGALAEFETDAFNPNHWNVTLTRQSTQSNGKTVAITTTMNRLSVSETTASALPTGLPFINATYPTSVQRPNSNSSWHFHCAYESDGKTNHAVDLAKAAVLNTDFPACTLDKNDRYRAFKVVLDNNFGEIIVGATLQGPCQNSSFNLNVERVWDYVPLVLEVCPGHDDAAHMGGRIRLPQSNDGNCFVDIGVYPWNQTVTGSSKPSGVAGATSASIAT